MSGVGIGPGRGMNLLPPGGRIAWPQQIRRQIMVVLAVSAMLLTCPLGPLSAAQNLNIAPFLSTEVQEQPRPLFPEVPVAERGQQGVNPRIAPGLQRLMAQSAAARASAGRLTQKVLPDRIKVLFQLAQGTTLDPGEIASRNGRVLRQRTNLVAVELPPEEIENLIGITPGIVFARLPHRFRPLSVTSEGVSLTGASGFHGSGYRGAGIKVAVIDVGFKGLTEAKASGDLPLNVITVDFTGRGLETRYKHGTACAEIIHDMAPEAELHLLKIEDEIDIYAAFEYCLTQGIKIISLSIGTFGSGPGNGTGPLHDLCNEARAQGILVVAAAGNGGNFSSMDGVPLGSHWEGIFTDANQDNFHEFAPGVQGNIMLAMPDHDDDGNPEHDEVAVAMRWNEWPHAVTDYDLYLYDYDYQAHTRGVLLYSSTGIQDGSQPPLEDISIDLPDDQPYRFYELVVARKSDSLAGVALEILTGGNSIFVGATPYAAPLATSAGSIMEPADGTSVFAVGAINQAQWTLGPQEDFSSQGPTNAWAGSAASIKPDISGPDGVGSNTYGLTFPGTSAAAPHVAGAAALLWSLHPHLLPGEVQSYLESWAQDMGTPGKDNLYGWGRLRLLIYTLSTSKAGLGSGTISSTPSGINCGSSCTASYASGATVTLTATAYAGSTFAGWSGGGCAGTGPCTVTMNAAKSVTATFAQIKYNLSVSKAGTGSGTVTGFPGGLNCGPICSASYAGGTPVILTASWVYGSTFTGWSGNCSGTGSCTVTMDAPKSVTATFALATYAITWPAVTNGTVSCNPTTVNHGANTTCLVTPGTGYHLLSLTDNGADVTSAMLGNTYTLNNVVSDHTLNPTFAINTYTITTAAGPNGTIAPSSQVKHGSSATVAITPQANYHVADVLVDGVSVGPVTSYDFPNVTASHTVSATFAINTYTLAITKAGTGSGTVTGTPGDINCGHTCSAAYVVGTETPVTLTAIPYAGSTFTGWSGGEGVCLGMVNCSLIMNKDIQVTALFASPWGDLNNDGKIDLTDAILTFQVLSNMDITGKPFTMAADANNDSRIGLAEAIYILQKVAGMR